MSHDTTTQTTTTLPALIDAQAGAALATDDVLVLVLPLFEQVAALHAAGRVATLDPPTLVLDQAGNALRLMHAEGRAPMVELAAIHRVQPHPASTLSIVGELRRSHTADGWEELHTLEVQADPEAAIERPVFLPGFASWELRLGHHDEITDVFRLGLVLAALACGLDFDDIDDVQRFAAHRRNLFQLADRLHPIVAAVIVEMTALNRHERATDLGALTTRLRTWRDQPPVLDVERALSAAQGAAPRRTAVLTHLRDRLFDLSRRNRLLYFKPTASSVNLTVSSVPLVLQLESIRPEHICTWGDPFAADVIAGRTIDLQRWLRFEDQPYLPVALDKLIQETRRDRAEYGFSNLRLVIAFLRWHNLKETPEERIVTPLLWLPVELSRRKGVRDQYALQAADGEAEFNPVLRHQLRQLYDIRLPETVDLQKTSIADVHADLLAQIQRTEPAVQLRLVDKPQIRLVRQKALQRLQQYQRRRGATRVPRAATPGLPDYSYERNDYRPLGRALFERWVRPSPLPQRFEAGAAPVAGPRHPQMMQSDATQETERVGFDLQESEGHRYAWDLDLTQVSLVNFNYKKMSLVRDYTQLIDTPDANPAFDRVFSIEPRDVETAPPTALPVRQRWNVVAADATQDAAVGLARDGRSFIIQGPPGTGKSQTITNLIADYAGEGKRVLFVCEKRAALDVVFHRLKQSGLDSLCCLIHDSQADKKAFIADLRTCYERWVAQPHDSDALRQQRDVLLQGLERQQQRIAAFETRMSTVPAALGTPLRRLVRRLLELPATTTLDAATNERLPDLAAWDAERPLANSVHQDMRERFGRDGLAGHPFARLRGTLLADERAYARLQDALDDAQAQFDRLDPLFEDAQTLIDDALGLEAATALADAAHGLLQEGLAGHLELLDESGDGAATLRQTRESLAALQADLAKAASTTVHWTQKLTPADTQAALALAGAMEGSALRWLQPAWWRLRGELRRRYAFGQHAVHPGYTRVVQALADEQAAAQRIDDAEAVARTRYGVADIQAFLTAATTLRERLPTDPVLRRLVAHLKQSPDPVAAARREASARDALNALAAHARDVVDASADTLGTLAELLRDLRESMDDLPDLLPLLRAVHGADAAVGWALRTLPGTPDATEAAIAAEALRRAERESPELARFDGVALARCAHAIARAQGDLLAANSRVVRATLHRLFTDNLRRAALSATQLDAVGKEFKKRYSTGRRELEHEFGKSMRHRSIRDLADDETGLVINDLKPIWLMSPLSVSDTLPLASDLFDVVIFDEASQIPTEEAVPALSRARQIVVVGDEMQLPPTSFFSASGDGEDEILVEEDGERIAINMDSDSLLNQAARNLPATLLAWHYRSRHEALISFSNAAFYDGRLVTIPDRRIEAPDPQSRVVRSDQEDAGVLGVETLLDRAVSFHPVADGVYEGRRNAPEARYIAQMVRELLARETGMSIGVVAFSEAQQDEIESALDALAAQDEAFALRLDREYVREDADQFNGLFIKNLENVQGDERDIIILSICYAPGPDGRMLMNFGPINQRGGEKRLNVIFSRARHRMAVVSTIQADAITNTHNDGAAALRAFLQFAQASARGDQPRAQQVLGALNAGAQEAFARPASNDAVRRALASALRARGHAVDENVGRSQFRCDLAVVDPDGGNYLLAILIDDPSMAATDASERYVFRPGVLRSFGWRTLDVPGRDWLRAPEAVLARIEAALAGEEATFDDADLDDDILAPPSAPATGTAAPAASPPPEAPDVVTRRFHFEQGNSRKFWQASLAGTELAVSYGRIGSQGQSVVKVFETPGRAQREMDKLVAEKLGKGYREA